MGQRVRLASPPAPRTDITALVLSDPLNVRCSPSLSPSERAGGLSTSCIHPRNAPDKWVLVWMGPDGVLPRLSLALVNVFLS